MLRMSRFTSSILVHVGHMQVPPPPCVFFEIFGPTVDASAPPPPPPPPPSPPPSSDFSCDLVNYRAVHFAPARMLIIGFGSLSTIYIH